jgi:hypothetical protein
MSKLGSTSSSSSNFDFLLGCLGITHTEEGRHLSQRIEYEDTEESDEVIDVRSPNCEPIHVPKQVKNALNDLKSAIHLNMAACHQVCQPTPGTSIHSTIQAIEYPIHVPEMSHAQTEWALGRTTRDLLGYVAETGCNKGCNRML